MSANTGIGAIENSIEDRLVPCEDFPVPAGELYLNAAGIGLVPMPVQRRVSRFLTALGQGGTASYFQYYEELMCGAQRAAATLWNAPAKNVAIATSVSEAISQVAWWRQPRTGENVVLLADDCSSATYPWLRVAKESGAEIRFARPLPGEDRIGFDCIAELVDENTAAISVSQVHWVTGVALDLVELGKLARANDALLIVDATHSAGVLPFGDEELAAADLLVTGCFKWLCAYAGAAPLYASNALLAQIEPILVGSRTSHPAPPFDEIDATRMDIPDDARLFEYGSTVTIPRMSMSASIDYISQLGMPRVRDHIQILGTRIAEELADLGAQIVTPLDPAHRAGIVSLRFPKRDSAELYAALLDDKLSLSLRAGLLRFSPHIYNDGEDIDRLVEIVKRRVAG